MYVYDAICNLFKYRASQHGIGCHLTLYNVIISQVSNMNFLLILFLHSIYMCILTFKCMYTYLCVCICEGMCFN